MTNPHTNQALVSSMGSQQDSQHVVEEQIKSAKKQGVQSDVRLSRSEILGRCYAYLVAAAHQPSTVDGLTPQTSTHINQGKSAIGKRKGQMSGKPCLQSDTWPTGLQPLKQQPLVATTQNICAPLSGRKRSKRRRKGVTGG